MKGPWKVNNLITSKIGKYKIWAILFCKNNKRVVNKDPRMYVQQNQLILYACLTRDGWKKTRHLPNNG